MIACLSDLRLDELVAGELPADAAAAASDHVAGCTRCRAREAALATDREKFRAGLTVIARRRAPWRTAVVGIAAAAAVMVVAMRPRGEPEGTRQKGRAHLGLVVVHGGAMRVGAVGEVVHPGDTLQYLVTTRDAAYVTVLGRDATGRVTTYVPAVHVAAGREVQLAIATLLDSSLGREEILAVFCPSLDAPPAGCTVDRLTIEKAP